MDSGTIVCAAILFGLMAGVGAGVLRLHLSAELREARLQALKAQVNLAHRVSEARREGRMDMQAAAARQIAELETEVGELRHKYGLLLKASIGKPRWACGCDHEEASDAARMEPEPTIKVTLTRSQALCLAGEYPVLGNESFADIEVEAREVLIRELISHGLLDEKEGDE